MFVLDFVLDFLRGIHGLWRVYRVLLTIENVTKFLKNLFIWTLIASASITVLASILSLFVVTFLLLVAPTGRIFSQPLYFDFTKPSPTAHVDFRASLKARNALKSLCVECLNFARAASRLELSVRMCRQDVISAPKCCYCRRGTCYSICSLGHNASLMLQAPLRSSS